MQTILHFKIEINEYFKHEEQPKEIFCKIFKQIWWKPKTTKSLNCFSLKVAKWFLRGF